MPSNEVLHEKKRRKKRDGDREKKLDCYQK